MANAMSEIQALHLPCFFIVVSLFPLRSLFKTLSLAHSMHHLFFDDAFDLAP